ncbi:MAG: hypothetical protein ACLGSD_01175 [Acidobacteriota bacterium]
MSLFRLGAAAMGSGLLLLSCGFTATAPGRVDVPVIVTAAPAYDALAALRGGERFPKGAHLLRIVNGEAAPLVPGFAASADAAVSYDAKQILFAGKKAPSDPWAIWELTIADGAVRKVAESGTDAIRPLYLPEGWLTYAVRTAHGFQVEVARLSGGEQRRVTFLESSAVPADVLADGRILFESGYPLGVSLEHGAKPEMYLVYPDGSGVESYRCDHGVARWGGRQLASGDVVFTQGGSLARFTSPLPHAERIAVPVGEYAGGVAESSKGEWVLSERSSAAQRYELTTWKPGSGALHLLRGEAGENLLEPVLVEPREPARAHPVALHPWNYANLLALDARLSRDGDLKTLPAKVRVEAEDASGRGVVLGTAPVASDGSFFVQVPGDKAIRFALLDAKGTVVRQEHGWFWIAKGEQRICVGCHTGPERAPENKVPQVLLETTIPVDLTGTHTHAAPGGR